MDIQLASLFCIAVLLVSSRVGAEEMVNEGKWSASLETKWYGSDGEDNFSTEAYLGKVLTDKWSVYVAGVHDENFESWYVGPARMFGDAQVGIGAGTARYGGESRLVVNPWVWYESDKWETYAEGEWYGEEDFDPWYYRGYVNRKVGDYFYGLQAERYVGIGPMMGKYFLDGKVKVSITVPLTEETNTEPMDVVVSVRISFGE